MSVGLDSLEHIVVLMMESRSASPERSLNTKPLELLASN